MNDEKQMKHYLGIDVGGTKTLAVLVNARGDILGEHRAATTQQGEAALAAQLVAMGQTLARDAGVAVQAVGIGMPGAVCPKTQSLSMMPNVQGVAGAGFIAKLRAAFGLPVALENDVNAAALGEAWQGGAGDPFVFLALGTGIGMGLVMNGALCRGRHGAAGEIAYLPLGAVAPTPAEYRAAMLENRLDGKAWIDAYHARGGGEKTLADCFAAPDAIFREVLAEQAERLALAVLAIAAVIDPQTVCLGGSIGLQPALQDALRRTLSRYSDHPPAIAAARLGAYAGAIGAARAGMMNGK
ncbi:MAG: ROK family protein [Cardiobacteriaceae bacterium]|nr:ROK family protein [Cardiobacteriaceae bacterium]